MDCLHLNEKGEDKRLINWKKLLEIRKQFHKRMHAIQHRTPSDLCMNAGKDYRTIKEKQTLHEYAKIPEITSKRGKPSFWDFPPASRKFPSLISVMPKPLDFEIPEIITVGVPTLIERENNTRTGKISKHSKWFKNEYLHTRNKELQHRLQQIEPHTPKINKLIVSSKSYQEHTKDEEVIESQSESEDVSITSESTIESCSFTKIIAVKSLQFEECRFTFDGPQVVKKHHIFINYEIGKDDIITNFITLTNVGNVTLRYYWNLQLPEKPNVVPHRLPMSCFYFAKSQNIIFPNRHKEIKIGFMTEKPGVYEEVWQLRTSPNVFEGKTTRGELTLVLFACAERADFQQAENAIEKRIEERMKYSAIEDTLLHILKRAQIITRHKKTDTGQKITEKDLFEAINAKFGPPGTLPLIYHYNEPIVRKLKHMYDALKTPEDPFTWNYKIADLEQLILQCPNKEEQNYYIFSFNDLVKNIYKSNMIVNDTRQKYQLIYDLLCVMVDQISDKVYALRSKFKTDFIETYPAVTKELLIKQEYLDDICRSYTYFPDATVEAAMRRIEECRLSELEIPGIEILKSIPFDDTEQRYKIYQKEKYGIDVDKLNAGNKGKGNYKKIDATKRKKAKTTDVKKKIVRNESVVNVQSISNLLTNKVEFIPELLGEDYEQPAKNISRLYHYNLYITVYLFLCEIANEIECILSYNARTKDISRAVLRKCIEFGIPTLPPSEQDLIYQNEFKTMVKESLSSMNSSLSDKSSYTSRISDISTAYSSHNDEFFKPISSLINIQPEVELVDAQTETDCEELFPLKIKIGDTQTENDDEEFDLVAQIEKQLSATSVQYIKNPTEEKATQVELEISYEELMTEGKHTTLILNKNASLVPKSKDETSTKVGMTGNYWK